MNWNSSVYIDYKGPVTIERGRLSGTRLLQPTRTSGICEGLAFQHVYLTTAQLKGRALPDVRR